MNRKFWVVFLLTAVGCSKGSTTSTNDNFDHATPFTAEKYFETDDPARYSVGCISPGVIKGGGSLYQLDSRLKPGMTQVVQQTTRDDIGIFRQVVFQKQVVTKTDKSVQMRKQLISKTGVLLTDLKDGAVETCSTTDMGPSCQPPEFFEYVIDKEVNRLEDSCHLSTQKFKMVGVTSGQYSFSNGKTVHAYKETYEATGQVVCGGKVVEKGLIVSYRVVSNEVAGLKSSWAACGGETIDRGFSVRGDSGKRYHDSSYRVLTAN